jgi:hypothetical protein
MQAKGSFKELLEKPGLRQDQPILSKDKTWAELPHIAYEDLSQIRIRQPNQVNPNKLALPGNLVNGMQDLYSRGADEKSVAEILNNEDNLKSIVLAKAVRNENGAAIKQSLEAFESSFLSTETSVRVISRCISGCTWLDVFADLERY